MTGPPRIGPVYFPFMVDIRVRDLFKEFYRLERKAKKKTSSWRRFISMCKRVRERDRHAERKGIKEPGKHWFFCTARMNPKWVAHLISEFFMENSDKILSAEGRDLEVMAHYFDVDQNLPTSEKQEKVYAAAAEQASKDPKWTKREIENGKKRFLEHIDNYHFLNLTCKIMGIPLSVVKGWIRTDPEFSDAVNQAQIRYAERIALRTMQEALEGGNIGAQMYILKQFEDVLKYVAPETTGAVVTEDLDVSRLTPEEQETLLRLMKKARNEDDGVPTEFIEEEEEPSAGLLTSSEPLPQTFIEDDSDLDDDDDITEVKTIDILPYDEGDEV